MRCLSDIITVCSIKKERIFINTNEGNNLGEQADAHSQRGNEHSLDSLFLCIFINVHDLLSLNLFTVVKKGSGSKTFSW